MWNDAPRPREERGVPVRAVYSGSPARDEAPLAFRARAARLAGEKGRVNAPPL